MNEQWHSITDIKCNSGKLISANAVAPKSSPWFSGHFPEEPILPGIAQLSMVFEIIKECNNKKDLLIKSLKKIKFKSIIRPEELLNISVTLNEKSDNIYSFKIISNDNIVCTGQMTV